MTIIVLTSAAGSPGVTTAATALAVHWPRPVLLIEADTSAVSTTMAGFFRSNLPTTSGGIEKIALAATRGVLRSDDLFDPELELAIAVHDLPEIPDMPLPSLPPGHRLWVAPGFVHLNVVDGVRSVWGRLPTILRSVSEAGVDVIVDLGRFNPDDERFPLLDVADMILLCASMTMVDLNRAYRRLELPDWSTRIDRKNPDGRHWFLLREAVAEQVAAQDFARHLAPVIGTLPNDPIGAATFALGRADAKPSRNQYRSAVIRAAAEIASRAQRDEIDRKVS